MTMIDPLACHLALTLLRGHEACPVCGCLASEHGGWQRELARGGLPESSRGRTVVIEAADVTITIGGREVNGFGEVRYAAESVGPECFGGDEYADEPRAAEHKHTCRVDPAQLLRNEDGATYECLACGERDCPHGEPLHYHHDGCPACA